MSPAAFGEPTMPVTHFSDLNIARDLEKTGFEREQAEALADAMRQASTTALGVLATKTDIAAIRVTLADLATKNDVITNIATKNDLVDIATKDNLKKDIAEVRDELRDDNRRNTGTLRSEMRWMFAFQGALILAITARQIGIL